MCGHQHCWGCGVPPPHPSCPPSSPGGHVVEARGRLQMRQRLGGRQRRRGRAKVGALRRKRRAVVPRLRGQGGPTWLETTESTAARPQPASNAAKEGHDGGLAESSQRGVSIAASSLLPIAGSPRFP
eukprot:7383647-Prymnesium_polylepis.1